VFCFIYWKYWKSFVKHDLKGVLKYCGRNLDPPRPWQRGSIDQHSYLVFPSLLTDYDWYTDKTEIYSSIELCNINETVAIHLDSFLSEDHIFHLPSHKIKEKSSLKNVNFFLYIFINFHLNLLVLEKHMVPETIKY
jgi:hypothetical protein